MLLSICSSNFSNGNTSIDSLRTLLLEEAKKSYEKDDEVFIMSNSIIMTLSTDSVELLLSGMPATREKAFSLSYLSYYQIEFKPKTAEPWIEEAKKIAADLNDLKLLYWVNRHAGFLHKKLSAYEPAIQAFKTSNNYAIKMNFERGRIINLIHFSEIYLALNDYEKAFEYGFSNLESRRAYPPDFGFAFAYFRLGQLYHRIGDYKQALIFYSKAEEIFRSIGDLNYTGVVIQSKTSILIDLSMLDSALVLTKKAVDIFQNTKSDFFLGSTYRFNGRVYLLKQNDSIALMYFSIADSLLSKQSHHSNYYDNLENIGQIYLTRGDYKNAEKYFSKCLQTQFENQNNTKLIRVYNFFSKLHLKQNNYKQGKEYALLAREQFSPINDKQDKLIALECLSNAYSGLGEYKEAFQIQKQISEFSLKNQQELESINIANLKLRNQINQQRDQLIKKNELAAKNQKRNNRIISLFALGAFILSIIFLKIIQIIRTRNKSLSEKNKEIAQFNEKLESNVNRRTKELHEKTQALNNYFDNLPGVAYRLRCDAESTPVFISKGCYDLLGLTPEYIVRSKTSRTLIHPDHYHKVIKQANAFIKNSGPDDILELVYPIQTKSKSRWVMDRSKILTDQDNNKYFQGILIDITDQMIAEAALKINQKELSIIYNNTLAFMGLIGIDQNDQMFIDSINQPYVNFLHKKGFLKKGQNITGVGLDEYFVDILQMPKEGIDSRKKLLNKLRTSKKSITYETSIPLGAENKSVFNITLTPIFEENKTLCSRIIFVLHEITAFKNAEALLKKSEKQLSTIYNSSLDIIGLINLDDDGKFIIESVNQPAIELFKNLGTFPSLKTLTGQSMSWLFTNIYGQPKNEVDFRLKHLKKVFDEQTTFKYESLFAPVGSDIQLFFETTISPITDINGNCTQALYVARDVTARKTAVDKVIANEKQLSMIFNGSKDVFFIFDVTPDGKFIFREANTTFKKRLSFISPTLNVQNVYGKDAYFFLRDFMKHSEEEVEERLRFARKAISQKRPQEYPEVFYGQDGNKYQSEVTVTPIYNEQGVCEKLFYVSRNVTQKIAVQQALASSEKRLSTIYNSSQDVIGLFKLTKEKEYEIESVNQPTIDLITKIGLPFSAEDFLGMKAQTLFTKVFGLPDHLVKERVKMMDQVFLENKTFKYNSPLAPIGSEIYLSFQTIVSPILDAEGKCTHALYTARDVTASEISKNKLLLSQKRLASIFNSTNDQMAIFDVRENGDIIFENCNDSLKKSWEATKIPLDISSFYDKDVQYYLRNVMRFSNKETQIRLDYCLKVIKDKKPVNYEDTFIAFDNKKHIVDVTISAILDEDDNCKKLLFVLRDVTLKHKAKERMISKILETEDRERSRFAKELHDSLGQNLTVASLNFNLVQKNINELNLESRMKFEAGFSFLKEAINESRNIAHNLMPQAISDFGYILSIESLIESLSQTTDISFSFYNNLNNQRPSPEHELSLYRITQEAINNILKHAEATVVTIQLIKHPNSLILTIEDNGKGFDNPAQIKNSFGLNSMRNRASALSGVIDIDSVPQKGTSIILEFPV